MPTETLTALLATYPKTLTIKDGTTATVRPMISDDEAGLLDFFHRVPEEDRFYLKDNVTDPSVVESWARNLDYARVLPLLADVEGKIVADATLHQRVGGAVRHMCEFRIVVDPAYRGHGLGTALLNELIDVATRLGLEAASFELVDGVEDAAIGAARRAGFMDGALLPHHVRGLKGERHDLRIMWMPLGKWYAWW